MHQESLPRRTTATASVWRLTDGLVGGTLVPRPDGTFTPIDLLKVGDTVASRDDSSGGDAVVTVTKLSRHLLSRAVQIVFTTGESIRATGFHRVFTVERGIVAVSLLRVGDHVETYDSLPLRIDQITDDDELVSVYEIAVDGSATYFAGAAGVRVQAP